MVGGVPCFDAFGFFGFAGGFFVFAELGPEENFPENDPDTDDELGLVNGWLFETRVGG